MFGYHGRYLRVDLSTGDCRWVPIEQSVLRRFVGGVGLGAYLLYQETPPGLDPLDPGSCVVFAFSPLVGTPLTTSAKFAVLAKSPLTGRLCDSLSSSYFAIAGKRVGMDALVVTGECQQLSVLEIDKGETRLVAAPEYQGRTPAETQQLIRARLGNRFQVVSIGPAGEHLVRYATISHDGRHAGRGGLGAVLGAKRLKAIALDGTEHAKLHASDRVVQISRALSEKSFGPATAKYRELGTVGNLLTLNRFAALPSRNFRDNQFSEAGRLAGENIQQKYEVARKSCAACTIGCEHIYRTGQGNATVRVEYETMFALGAMCGISSPETVLQAAKLCDELGLDTISTGVTVGFALECAERKLLTANISVSSTEDLLAIVRQIGYRTGIGDTLAEGTRLLAERLGEQAKQFAPHVKGLEIPGYEPRALQTMALGFAVGTRGADHNRSGAYEADFSDEVDRFAGNADNARHAIETEDRAALLDSLILCKFIRGVFSDLYQESADMLGAVTGWTVTSGELHLVAQRVVNLRKLYNQREGWDRSEDTLPPRILTEPLRSGVAAGTRLTRKTLNEMIQSYYRLRGWTETGEIPVEELSRLSLDALLPRAVRRS